MIALSKGYDDDNMPVVTLSVGGEGDKAAAIQRLLPDEVWFGNVVLKINIEGKISDRAFVTNKELFETAFENNPVFAYAVAPAEEGYWYPDMTFVVFKNCVVQFFNDNLDDCHGIVSTLYEDIADDIFAEFKETCTKGMVYFNTDIEVGNLGKPLG
jgi:hypothetical protein